ncbi:valine n-monooxygenase 1 [Phtheirospermum japonicum]|uniref:Valine n-monooxygenase 1 n=1 Tax=Phtheirospermum japonicum TaxID=374723 RepID=A0A830BI72_9LAMI|nr:valine n-monooxygenase 1 [Phtheirospermum japonicum]
MIKHRSTFRWIHKLMQQNNTEIACIRLGKTYIIPVTSPDLAREFLWKQDEIFASRPEYMSAKLASSDYLTTVLSPVGDQWKKMRRIVASEILSPAMHRFLHIKRCEEADHLVRYIYNQCRKNNHGHVNIRVAAQHYCGNVIRKLVFGKRFFGLGMEDGGPGKEEEDHVESLFTILRFLYGFGIGDFVPWLEVFDFDGHKRIISKAVNSVRKYQDPEILKRVEMWRKGINKETEKDILDVLINLKDSKNNPTLSIQEIKAQITEIMLATVDNPSNAVEWAIAEMINQPHILENACKELDRLNYIKSCIKKSFRLHPVAPFNLPHVSIKDTIVGGYFIPKGSHVLVSRPGLGRNPRIWEDPLKYKPERHIIDEEKEATMLLARLLQGFSWADPLDGSGCIELAESENELLMAKPLIAFAKPRLEPRIYHQLLLSE